MHTHRFLNRFSIFILILGLAFGSIFLLLKVITPTQAMPLAEHNAPQSIIGTVTLWYAYTPGNAEEAALFEIISNTLAENPGLTITATFVPFADIFQLYETQVISGGGPDMFIAPNDWLGHEARMGVISNLDYYLEGRLTGVYTSAIETMKMDGSLYGVPESAKAVALFYNESTITTPLTTTADLLSAVQEGKKLAITTNGGGSYFNFGFYGAFGGQLLDSEGRCIASGGGVAPAMQYLVDLAGAGATLITDTWAVGRSAFCNREIDLLIDGVWDLVEFKDCLADDLGLMLIPAGPIDVAKPITGVDGFYVNPNTADITTTVELALIMTNQASAQIFTDIAGHVPVRTDVVITDPFVATFTQAAEQGWPRFQGAQMNNYWGPFGVMMDHVLSGRVTPVTGVKTACDTMNWLSGFSNWFFLPAIRK